MKHGASCRPKRRQPMHARHEAWIDDAARIRVPDHQGVEISTSSLPFLNVRGWAHKLPPARQWAVPDLIPAKNVAVLSGHGATGKTTLALQLCAATVLG